MTIFLILLGAALLCLGGLGVFLFWLFEEDFNGDHRHE